jgi:hypothetical protein
MTEAAHDISALDGRPHAGNLDDERVMRTVDSRVMSERPVIPMSVRLELGRNCGVDRLVTWAVCG